MEICDGILPNMINVKYIVHNEIFVDPNFPTSGKVKNVEAVVPWYLAQQG